MAKSQGSAEDWVGVLARNVESGSPFLEDSGISNAELLDSCLPGLSQFVPRHIDGDSSTDVVATTGTFDLRDHRGCPATLRVKGNRSDWTGEFGCRGPAEAMSLPVFQSAEVEELGVQVRMAGNETTLLQADMKIAGRMRTGDQRIPFSLRSAPGQYRLRIVDRKIPLEKFGNILSSLSCGDVLNSLPLADLSGDLDLYSLDLIFDSTGFLPSNLSLSIGLPRIPCPVEGVVLRDVGLSLSATNLSLPSNLSVSVSVVATLVAGQTEIAVYGSLPEFVVSGQLRSDDGLPLRNLLAPFIPDGSVDVPDLSIRELDVRAALSEPALAIRSILDGRWQIPNTGAELRDLRFDLELSQSNPHIGIHALTDVRGTSVMVTGVLGPELEFTGEFEPTTLSSLLGRFGLHRPPEVPEVEFGPTEVVISGSEKIIRIRASASLEHDFFSVGEPVKLDVSVDIDVQPGKKPSARLALGAKGNVPITDDFQVDTLDIVFGTKGDSWYAEGSLRSVLFDNPLNLAASYEQSSDFSRLRFAIDTSIQLVDLPDVVSLYSRSLWLVIERGEQGRVVSVSGTALLEVNHVFDYDAILTLSGSGLRLRPNLASRRNQELSIPVGPDLGLGKSPSVQFDINEIAVARTQARDQKPEWRIVADADVRFINMPAPVNAVFTAEPAKGAIVIDGKAVSISVDPAADQSIDLSIGGDSKLPLPILDVQSLFLRRRETSNRKSEWELGAAITARHFDRLNKFVGGSLIFCDELGLDLLFGEGLTVRPRSSPFRNIRLRTLSDGTVWTAWHEFEGVGNLSFQVPELAFDFGGGRWRAAGGVMSKGTLSLPLAPAKWLAGKCGVPKAALNNMPDGIPLREVDIASPEFFDDALDALGSPSKATVSAFRKFAEILQKGAENFPDEFAEYLSIQVPGNFRFELAIEPSGGAHVELGVADDKPVKVVFPTLVGIPPLPGLTGITLYRLGFGLTSGGSIGVLKFDGWLDRLDLLNLGFALATGKGQDISNRLTLRDLVALVPMAAPIPMPLFYRTFSWRYKNMLGLGLQLEASFPDPEPALSDWARLIVSLAKFFAVDDFYLHKKGNLPGGMALPFTLGPARMSLPRYLGGAEIGTGSKLPALRVQDTLARGIDGIKAGNAGWIIESVPLNYRKGSKTQWPRISNIGVEFGPLSFDAVACVTTDHEFRNIVLKDANALKLLADAGPEEMLGCTPASMGGKAYDKGFLVLLSGRAAVQAGKIDLFRYSVRFGMALTGPGDFQTAIKKEILFGPDGFIAIQTAGLIKTRALPKDQGRVAITVAGELALLVYNKKYALGSTVRVIPGKLFEASIRLVLADDFVLAGTLRISDKGAAISGHVIWDIPGKGEIRIRCSASISGDGIVFEPAAVRIGELSTRMYLRLPGQRRSLFDAGFELDLPPGFTAEFRKGLKTTANKVVGSEVKDGYALLLSAIASRDSYEASLRGIRSWLPATCSEVIKIVNHATTRKAVHKALNDWAGKNLFRKGGVALVKPFAHEEVREAVEPWLKKLRDVRSAAKANVDKHYRGNLRKALKNLIKSNEINLYIGEFGKFPGLRVYRHAPVLSKQQVSLVNQAIEAIDALPAATDTQVKADRVLKAMPKSQLVLADVKNSIDQGIDAGIPNIRSVRFEKSVRPLLPDDVSLRVEIAYQGKVRVIRLETNLWKVESLPKQIAEAFAEAI